MSILSSELSPHGDEIRSHSTSHVEPVLPLFSHKGLVPILHLFVVRLWLTKTCSPFTNIGNQTRIACVAVLYANHYTIGSGASRISRRGRVPRREGVDTGGSYISKIFYVETKESAGPLRGRAPCMPPPL